MSTIRRPRRPRSGGVRGGLASGSGGSRGRTPVDRLTIGLRNTGPIWHNRLVDLQANPSQSVVGPERLATLVQGWSNTGHGTLAQRLAHAVRQAIASGLLGAGTRLPSERRLASALSVSRSTVTAALDELRADGAVASRVGSGTVVAVGDASSVYVTRVAEHVAGLDGIDLAMGYPPDASHLPPLDLDVAALLASGEGPGVQPLGLASLRRALADRHSQRGLHTSPQEIHVTAGAHQALALALDALARGGVLAVQEACHPSVFDMAETIGARLVAVRGDSAGMVPDELERVILSERPSALYVQNGPHNPTGVVAPAARVRAIAELVDRHGVPVIEDRVSAPLVFDRTEPLELGSLCRAATIVRVDSFSKVAWAGLRVGWMRAPAPFVERTLHLRLAVDLGPSVPSQLMALELLGHLDDLADARRSTLRGAVDRALASIRADLPDWRPTEPQGGSAIWVELPIADSRPFVAHATRHGVSVAAGSLARLGNVADPHIRICVDRPAPVVDAGIERLVRAWHDFVGRSSDTS